MEKTYKIGAAFPKWYDGFGKVIQGAYEYTSQNPQYQLVDMSFFHADEVPDYVADYNRNNRLDGLLTWMPGQQFPDVRAKLPDNLPIVGMSHEFESLGVPSIKEDLESQMEMAIRHFHDVGVKNIAYLHCRQCHGANGFETYYRQQMRRFRIEPEVFFYPYPSPVTSPAQVDTTELENWIKPLTKPLGVICFGPIGANLLARACHNAQLEIPNDVAIISRIDDRTCLLCDPPITAINFPHEQFGVEMMILIASLLNGRPAAPLADIPPLGLNVRGSSGKLDDNRLGIARAVRYIQDHACQGITVEQVIEKTQTISRSKFFHLFQEQIGQSPYEAIRTVRIKQACHYLANTNMSISKIAEQCGYSESRHFSTAFGREVGKTPSTYRKEHRNHNPEPCD